MTLATSGLNNSGAPVSPPGALSQRTDMQPQGAMQLPDAAYGEQQDFQQIQGGALMQGQMTMPTAPPTGLMAPTERPEEPVTAGAPIGPGPGMEALPSDDPYQRDMKMLSKYMPQFEAMAADENTPESFRLFVRYVRANR